MYEIKTDKFKKERKVLIDGIEATVQQVGAGTQLTLSQTERRLELINRKLKAGYSDLEQMERDISQAEKLEDKMFDFFNQVIRDGSEDNATIKAWIDHTPLEVIQATFEEMQKQFKENDAKVGDGTETKEVSPANA